MIKVSKTAYQWCLDSNIRILDIKPDEEKDYYTLPVTKLAFMTWLTVKTVKPNTTPRKTDPYLYLEYRMYFLVPYNISGRQAGIQALHAVVRYGRNVQDMGRPEKLYNLWADEWETVIMCNGGTTNEDKGSKWYGSMQKMRDALEANDIIYSEFKEPDINNSLTGVAFLVDERVFNEELYPNYVDIPKPWADKYKYRPKDEEMSKWEEENAKNREKWVEKIGGPKNDFLRTFTNKHTLRLANN